MHDDRSYGAKLYFAPLFFINKIRSGWSREILLFSARAPSSEIWSALFNTC